MDEWWPLVPVWREEIKATFARWEQQDPNFVALWRETRDWSMADFHRIFTELGADFDVWFFESEVEEEGKRIVQQLLEREIAEVSDGLPVVKIDEKLGLEEPTYRTLPILRSDGTTLYATKDLALTKRKFEQYGIDRAIWVVDVRQSLYFQQVFKVLELFGFAQAARAQHLGYELVSLPEGIISSRKGNVPVYDDIRDAVLARAQAIIEEKNPALPKATKGEVAWQVAIGSLKYAMLARDNTKVVVFNLDEALSFDGHAAPYIQYAHARACRILEHAETSDADLIAAMDGLNVGDLAAEELGLLQGVAALPDEVQRAAAEVPAAADFVLCLRAGEAVSTTSITPARCCPRRSRRARADWPLVAATRQTLANGLNLLGIAAPAEM